MTAIAAVSARALTPIVVAVYLAAIVAANLVIAAYGPGAAIAVAFALIGLDLTARDWLHEAWTGRGLAWRMAGLIAAGSAISWILNAAAAPIAVASTVAFAAAASTDAVAYALLGDRARALRINGSNVASAAVDSILFPTIAFGVFLPAIILGQWLAKVAGGFVWMLVFDHLPFRRR